MGGIIARLRAKPSTKDLLEDLEKEIEAHEEYKRSTEQQHKRVVGGLVFYFIVLFIVASAVFILYYYPLLSTTQEKVIYSIPLWAVPVIFYALKKFLHWYFTQKIKYNEENLAKMKKRRRSLLDFAMETETYKTVKELLEKFDPEYHRKVFESIPAIEAPPPIPTALKGSFGEIDLKRRTPSKPVIMPGQTVALTNAAGPAPVLPPYPSQLTSNIPLPSPFSPRNSYPFVRSPMPQMPRPVLKQERSLVDRIVDYLVGDGPSNRYALICRQCQSHNGMALKEEFEFVAFRCCYCFHWNPPRNQQPPPPRLQLPAPSGPSVEPPPPSETSSTTSGPEALDAEDIQEDSHDKNVEDVSFRSSSESPSLRRRLHNTPTEEITAHLEEDVACSSRSSTPTGSQRG